MDAESLKTLVLDFFGAFGSRVEDVGRWVYVFPAEPLVARFGAAPLKIIFNPLDADEETTLFAPGCHLLELMHEALGEEPKRSFVRLADRFTLHARDLFARKPLGDGCTADDYRATVRLETEARFTIKASYGGYDLIEEIHMVGVDSACRARVLTDPSPPASLVEERAGPQLDAAETEHRFRAACSFLQSLLHTRADRLRQPALDRLHETLLRLRGYFQQLRSEARPRAHTIDERQMELDEDYERMVRTEVENHAVRVTLDLLHVALVDVPVTDISFTLRRGGASRAVAVRHNRFSGEVDWPVCDACGRTVSSFALCRSGHLICESCVTLCASCGQPVCARCGLGPCERCGAALCAACSATCAECGARLCSDHLAPCARCGHRVCDACGTDCEVCRRRACKTHMGRCAACSRTVCPDCRRVCAVCGEPVCRGHVRSCEVCGQGACERCTAVCDDCGASVCAHHAYACGVCHAMVCERHAVRCEICGAHVCGRHAAACAGCGRPVCSACGVTGEGGRRLCAPCAAEEAE